MNLLTAAATKHHSVTITVGVLSALAYVYLALNSQYYGDASLTQLLSVSFTCAGLSFGLWVYYRYARIEPSSILIVGFAILFRIIGVSAFPILEDDMYRYLWDGYMTHSQGTPYSIAPAEFFDTQLSDRFELVLGLINYPEVATVYGPIVQMTFALAYLISPGEIWPLQLIAASADIALMFLLLKLAKPSMVLLYAWSPLIIKEFAFTAHPDVLGALFLILAFLMYQRERFALVGLFLAFATGVKVFALIAVPFLLMLHWRGWLVFVGALILTSLPFTSSEVSIAEVWIPEGLAAMGSEWLFNAPVYALLAPFTGSLLIKLALLTCLASACGLYWLHSFKNQAMRQPRIDLLFLGLLICLPALNPWYLVWLLPFAAVFPSVWAWTASTSLLLSYASGINLTSNLIQSYQIPGWVMFIEFGVIVLSAILAQRFGKKANANFPANPG